MKRRTFLALDLMFVVVLVTSCGNTRTPAPTSSVLAPTVLPSAGITLSSPPVPSLTFLPFEAVSETPPGEFLFVFLHDDDDTCLDGLCVCPVAETPAESFKFVSNQLLLMKYDFEPMPQDWATFRMDRRASILYNFFSSQIAEFRLFASFPVETPIGNFVITGVNSRGEIQVQTKDETTVLRVGSKAYAEEPEQKDPGCRILHKYSLTNYGFIKDENVKLVTGW